MIILFVLMNNHLVWTLLNNALEETQCSGQSFIQGAVGLLLAADVHHL